jgi:hypothetical protein
MASLRLQQIDTGTTLDQHQVRTGNLFPCLSPIETNRDSTPSNGNPAVAPWDRVGGRPPPFEVTQRGYGIDWLSHFQIVEQWSADPVAIVGVRSSHVPGPPDDAADELPSGAVLYQLSQRQTNATE